MSIEIQNRHERAAREAAREMALSLLTIPRKYPVGWAIAWTALLLGLCLAPARAFPDEDSISIKKYLPHTDLAVHFSLFAVFAASWIGAVRSPSRWAIVPVAGLILAVATEYAQGLSFIQRDPAWLDGLADIVGVVVGLVGSAIFQLRSNRRVRCAD
jgi:VanZ family protein